MTVPPASDLVQRVAAPRHPDPPSIPLCLATIDLLCLPSIDYVVKRVAVIKKIKQGAKDAGVRFEMYELRNHSGVRCGEVATTVPRHNEISEQMAEVIYRQLAPALGERWWTM